LEDASDNTHVVTHVLRGLYGGAVFQAVGTICRKRKRMTDNLDEPMFDNRNILAVLLQRQDSEVLNG
jgi:hypothetical protein